MGHLKTLHRAVAGFLPRLCVLRGALSFLERLALEELKNLTVFDFVPAIDPSRLVAGPAQEIPLPCRSFTLASINFVSCFTLRGDTPRTSAVSLAVENFEFIVTVIMTYLNTTSKSLSVL
jgi:hypothetical protein